MVSNDLKQIFLNDKCIWLACMRHPRSNLSYGNCYKSYRHSINLGIHKLRRLSMAVIIQSLIIFGIENIRLLLIA